MAETTAKILNAEIDVRSHFSTFDFPKLPEVIQAIEEVFHADITKVVKSLRGPLMGIYKIQAADYTVYKDKSITLRGKELPVILRTKQEQKKRDGLLVTIYDSYSPDFQGIKGTDFDHFFINTEGVTVIKQTTPQFYKGTRVLNGNRYIIVEVNTEKIDLGEFVHVGNAQFKIQYTGMKRYCYLCNERHGVQCAAKEEFERMKAFRKDKLTHKIYADSSLRHVNQLALAANVACTTGGGIGQIVNAIRIDPEPQEKVIIYAGANEIKHTTDTHEFTLIVNQASEKLHELTKTKIVTLILPTMPLASMEEKARYELLKATMVECKNITTVEIEQEVEYINNHPTTKGTTVIIDEIEKAIKEPLVLEPRHVVTERRYSQVQACYKMGCRTCDTPVYTNSICNTCHENSKKESIAKYEAILKGLYDQEFPEENETEMAEINKRSNEASHNEESEENLSKKSRIGNNEKE